MDEGVGNTSGVPQDNSQVVETSILEAKPHDESIRIDRSLMPSQKLEGTFDSSALNDLKDIGVESFLVSDFEANVIKQVDEQMESNEKMRAEKRIQELEAEERAIQSEIKHYSGEATILSRTLKTRLSRLEKSLRVVQKELKNEANKLVPNQEVSQTVKEILGKQNERTFENQVISSDEEDFDIDIGKDHYEGSEELNIIDEDSGEEDSEQSDIEYDNPTKKRKLERLTHSFDDYNDENHQMRIAKISKRANMSLSKEPMVRIDKTYTIPKRIFSQLLDHQKVAIRWLWEIHKQNTGCILGDEMGLGKTVEMIAFLNGLWYTKRIKNPILILCPATVIHQWLREFHIWAPSFRIFIYHGSIKSNKSQSVMLSAILKKCLAYAKSSDDNVSVLLTTYDTVRINSGFILPIPWEYVVLDEGHKIRNPNATITTVCKQFNTFHRIILSGSPIQNNLIELWSLFDFIFPGRLGTLPMFESQFSIPILRGGFKNASIIEVRASYKCATILKGIIDPYLLRRTKGEVKINLPGKNEQVLFCQLTVRQKERYQAFLRSKDAQMVYTGKKNLLSGVDILRKICNYCDLADGVENCIDNNFIEKSSKLRVINHILPAWKEGGHRVLIFTQTRQMLDIMERFIKSLGFEYRRMDGTTPVSKRVTLIDEYNTNREIFVFLLTTKVGGLGVNLTSADRVILFDPDWNPMTDVQARERAYRIGQTREISVYRLITSGTIEEKIYHRQIFKQLLSDKVLKDPKLSRSLFSTSELKDLFRLDDRNHTSELYTEQVLREEDVNLNSEDEYRNEKSTDNDDWLLKGLMGDDLHSKIKHDQILDVAGSEQYKRPMDMISEQEAEKLAKLSIQRLKESRESISNIPISTPTFTGKSPPKRFGKNKTSPSKPGPSSEDIKQSLQNSSPSKKWQSDSALEKLHQFMISHNNCVTSKQIVEYFKEKIPKEQLTLFRRLLKEVASFDEDSKVWKLNQWASK